MAQGPLPELLKLRTTYGPAHEEQEIAIEGFPFYVGALFYSIRVGNDEPRPETGGGRCRISVRVPGRNPGLEPVWASEYGGGGSFTLAGFYSFGSDLAPSCAQPGYPCDTGPSCCATADVPMACVGGRCRPR